MKKFVIIGLVLAALAFASCDKEKGGTIEVVNEVTVLTIGVPIEVSISKLLAPTTPFVKGTIEAGGRKTFSIEEDGIYFVTATIAETGVPLLQTEQPNLSGGNKVTITFNKPVL